jgi:hypothetical protein
MLRVDETMKRRIGLLFAVVLSLAPTGAAWAHGGGPGLNYDPCAKPIGQYYVHMAVYQPDINRFQEYCGSIPTGGKTLLVFDLVGAAMRQIPVGVDIMDRGGRTGSYKVLSVPAAEHRSGVIDLNLSVEPGHSYVALVTVGESPASTTVVFPIQVRMWWSGFEIPALLAIAGIAIGIYYSLRLWREQAAAMRKTEMRTRIRAVGSP